KTRSRRFAPADRQRPPEGGLLHCVIAGSSRRQPPHSTAPMVHCAVLRATPRWSVAAQLWPALRRGLIEAGLAVGVGPPLAASAASCGSAKRMPVTHTLSLRPPTGRFCGHCTSSTPLPGENEHCIGEPQSALSLLAKTVLV